MATVYSVQRDATTTPPRRNHGVDVAGKVRLAYGFYTNNTGGTLADGTVIEMLRFPAGRIRILGPVSRYSVSALSTSRTLDIGHGAYVTGDDTTEAADPDDLVAADSVATAVTNETLSTELAIDYYSQNGITINMTVNGGTIPAAATFELAILYVTET